MTPQLNQHRNAGRSTSFQPLISFNVCETQVEFKASHENSASSDASVAAPGSRLAAHAFQTDTVADAPAMVMVCTPPAVGGCD